MKLRSMEEKISYRLFLMGFLGLLFTAALCIFVFHKAFTAKSSELEPCAGWTAAQMITSQSLLASWNF